MRILIDECLDWRLGRAMTGQDCVSVQKMGRGGIKNGRLLALASASYSQSHKKSNRKALLLAHNLHFENKLRNFSL